MKTDYSSLQFSLLVTITFVFALVLIKFTETITAISLHTLGVYPLDTSGLPGILLAPLIHGGWQHLAANSLSLVLLGTMLIYGYPKSRWWALSIIWFLSGLGVWLLAREVYHIGASGLTHGMFFFLFINGILRRDKRSIVLLMIAFFMHGSMIMTIFPREIGVSYEYHFFGAVAGTLSAIIFRNWDPMPEVKKYDWEQKIDESEDDPVIGDLWQQTPSIDVETSENMVETDQSQK